MPWWLSSEQGPTSDQPQVPSSKLGTGRTARLLGHKRLRGRLVVWMEPEAQGRAAAVQDVQGSGRHQDRRGLASYRAGRSLLLKLSGARAWGHQASGERMGTGCLHNHTDDRQTAEQRSCPGLWLPPAQEHRAREGQDKPTKGKRLLPHLSSGPSDLTRREIKGLWFVFCLIQFGWLTKDSGLFLLFLCALLISI